MFKKIKYYVKLLNNRYHHIESSMKSFSEILERINRIDLSGSDDQQLKEISSELKTSALKGAHPEDILVEAFALVREVSQRVLGMRPYDVQIIAGIALHRGHIAEMQTGEGKTLCAVMPAYLNALNGKGVHILTFNNYLAQRDALWMGPIYDFLGLKATYIYEGMSNTQRQEAYRADVTYVTAKEAGFDYLRDTISLEINDQVHRNLHYALVDEADSILIDEARVPLVIAGGGLKQQADLAQYAKIVNQLELNHDYKLDKNRSNIYLTETGISHVEKLLGLKNIFEANNLGELTRINCALYAEALLKRDQDYIIRNDKVELVDEFTGRVAENRHWPEGIQAAVEAKEKIESGLGGKILGSIALQHYLSLYSKLAGMTGTAITSAAEFHEFYSKDVVVIPTNKECIRIDHPPQLFKHKEAKLKTLLDEITRVHKAGQPVLIGTGSVRESEELALKLHKSGIQCNVLNAKNDALEAVIIARAGEPGAVTVSTNMAGRGIDIKLGGVDENYKEIVAKTGGLYIIGTTLHESRRIDNQLKGRAGRQGDPGESRFFISLEDEFCIKYEIDKLISDEFHASRQDQPLQDKEVLKALAQAQRIVEGYHEDMRRQLWKYSSLIEEQRRIIHLRRSRILKNEEKLELLRRKAPERYDLLRSELGSDVLYKVEKVLTLYYINSCWAEYLDHVSYLRDTIHLVIYGKKDPLDEFNRSAIEAFDEMLRRIDREIVSTFLTSDIDHEGIHLENEGLTMPSATWTYLIEDNPPDFLRSFANFVKLKKK